MGMDFSFLKPSEFTLRIMREVAESHAKMERIKREVEESARRMARAFDPTVVQIAMRDMERMCPAFEEIKRESLRWNSPFVQWPSPTLPAPLAEPQIVPRETKTEYVEYDRLTRTLWYQGRKIHKFFKDRFPARLFEFALEESNIGKPVPFSKFTQSKGFDSKDVCRAIKNLKRELDKMCAKNKIPRLMFGGFILKRQGQGILLSKAFLPKEPSGKPINTP